LAEFAARRHEYGNTDGGFGVTYPGDLDEYDREVDGIHVPEGFVQVYGFWGPPDGYEVLVPELAYLDTLADVLSATGHSADGERVRALAEKQSHAEPEAAADGGT
jgi:attachment invasion locus protein